MSFTPVIRVLAFALCAVALAMAAPTLLALGQQEPAASTFGLGLFLAVFLAACLFAVSTGIPRKRPTRSGFRELILALSLFWLAVPCIAAVPFLGDGFRPDEAWFEAVAALTTTGGWLSEPVARATTSGMVYRASLQWLGGLASLATAAAVFVRPEFVGIQPPIPPFARGTRDSYLRAFATATRTFLPVYAGITGVSVVAFMATGVAGIEALSLGLSFIASGGFVPRPGGIEGYGAPAVTVASLTMLAGAVNFVVIARLALRGRGRFRSGPDPETVAFLALIAPVGALYWASLGTFDPSQFPHQLGNAVSMLSTSGIIIGDAPQLTPILVTATIGGAAVSTAGGIKLLRWLITFRRAGQELWQLTHPGGILKRPRPLLFEFGVWIHTIAFTIVLAGLVLTVAFFGYELEFAAATAVAVVTNSGPLLAAVDGSTADFVLFTAPLRMLLALGMIAGRLELVLLLLLFDREFWRG